MHLTTFFYCIYLDSLNAMHVLTVALQIYIESKKIAQRGLKHEIVSFFFDFMN